MARKILMTGGTGFVGRELGVALARAGWELRLLTRSPEKARGTLPFPAELHAFDATTYAIPPEALDGVDAVVHLAGESVFDGSWSAARRERIRASRVDSTAALARAIAAAPVKPRAFVQASAIGYYGDQGDAVLTEASSPGDDFLAKVCVAWEDAAQPARAAGVRWAALRIGMVLGHGGGALQQLAGVYNKGLGARLGSGSHWVSWIHLDDLVRLVTFSVEDEGAVGPINAVAPEPCRFTALHEALARALGRPAWMRVPKLAVRAALGRKAQIALASQRVVPAAAARLGFAFTHATIDDAVRALYADAVEPGASRMVARQWLPRPPSEVWPFFCDESNLERITPPWIGFHVLGKTTPAIGEGTEIDYKLRLHGVPLRWRSRIEEWRPPRSFVDRQVRGPYGLWHHTHRFEPLAGGTLLTDAVQYRLPLDPLGGLAAGVFVDKDVEKIFAYRQQAVREAFAEAKA